MIHSRQIKNKEIEFKIRSLKGWKLGVVAHVYNSSILKVKTGVFGVEFIFSYKFKASLGYETLSLKKQSKTNKSIKNC